MAIVKLLDEDVTPQSWKKFRPGDLLRSQASGRFFMVVQIYTEDKLGLLSLETGAIQRDITSPIFVYTKQRVMLSNS